MKPSNHQPSAPLTRDIARGDEAAFARFYDLWFDRTFALVRSITRRDEAFCLDVVQDCMMSVVHKMRPLRSEAAVAAWMARTITNRAVDRLRAERRRRRHERAVAQDEVVPSTVEESALRSEHLAWLQAQLAELPERDRAMLAARFEGEQSIAEVGADLGLSIHAVHGRIRRLVDRLRTRAKRQIDE